MLNDINEDLGGGSPSFSFVAIGDTVNVASRLEGVSKDIGAPIVASHEIMSRQEFSADDLAAISVTVRGRATELLVYPLQDEDAARYLEAPSR